MTALRRLTLALIGLAALVGAPAIDARQALTWTDVTPSGITTGTGDDYGPEVIFTDPTNNANVWVYSNYHGVYKSTDYGVTYSRIDVTAFMDDGKLWGGAIAPDASYLLASSGNNVTQCSGTDCRRWVLKSTDGGVNWSNVADLGVCDPYMFDIDASDAQHVIATCHEPGVGNLFESLDAGATWADKGEPSGLSNSAYGQFWNSSTVLLIGEGDACAPGCQGVFRGTKSGSTWTFSRVADMGHFHGSHRFFMDTTNNQILNGGGNGIDRSTDGGVNWTRVSTSFSNVIHCTPLWCYSGYGYPNQGSFGPGLMHASRSNPTSWTADSDPSGMVQGPAMWALLCDGTHYVLLSAARTDGIWRAVTAETCGGGSPTKKRLRFRRDL